MKTKNVSQENLLSFTPLSVGLQLAQLRQDEETVIAGLLHDVLEDTRISEMELRTTFGDSVFCLVKGVTNVHYFYDQENNLVAKNLKRFFQCIQHDVRVLIVKLIDRLNNMQTLQYYSDREKQKQKALETFTIYVPLAVYAGLFNIGNELSDLCLRYIDPEMYLYIQQRLKMQYTTGDADIDAIIRMLTELLSNNGIRGHVTGRLKTVSSVWGKMQNQVVSFNQLSDIIGFRILVRTIEECYRSQKLLSKEFEIVVGSFKDYIRMPKNNNYQSLHCLFSLPPYEQIEVQIRTHEMNNFAENGVAHHALYKQRYLENLNPFLSKILNHALPQKNLSLQEHGRYSHEKIYCFSPNGGVIFLPQNSTCLDFASKIHSEIRDNATSALVNGQEVPLTTKLKLGDEVYIYTTNDKRESA